MQEEPEFEFNGGQENSPGKNNVFFQGRGSNGDEDRF